ncbi:MAG: hypothetical protein KF812_01870 [Fimbriimonadaceae bacterium]|nr:hypothetical protein [Fimbriimonadaceae bacterium]
MLQLHPALILASLIASTALAAPAIENSLGDAPEDAVTLFEVTCGSFIGYTSYVDKTDYRSALGMCPPWAPYAEFHWACQKAQYQNGYIWYAVAGEGYAYPCHGSSYEGSCADSTCTLL